MEPKPCLFPRCPALAEPSRDHCPVHRPERVVERAKSIVNNHFAKTTGLRELHHSIIDDLERTV